MKNVPFYNIKINGGFWGDKQRLVTEKTLWAVYDRFKETGRIETMDCKDHGIKPHNFWCSDVFKWIEGAAYILESKRDEKILNAVREIVDMVEVGISDDGYYNSCYNSPYADKERFTDRDMHELYSIGHMIEAGVALYHATGDGKLLNLCIRAADFVYRVFKVEDSAPFMTPGHEEIELALVRLYHTTGDKKYLDLSEYFVRQRGKSSRDDSPYFHDNGEYLQSHIPITEQKEAVGHCVRAVYLYSAIADLALELDDNQLFEIADRLFEDIYRNKMYITGGIGSVAVGETFSVAGHLPNFNAYAETCAALGLAMFCRRMYSVVSDSKYADVAERALFNGMLSGLSLDGEAFFYTNPLEIDIARKDIPRTKIPATQRKKVFGCSCCPPNLVRLIPSIADYIYTYDDSFLYVHQYIANQGEIDGNTVEIKTNYPVDGKLSVKFSGNKKVVIRCPDWCETVKTKADYTLANGYMYFDTNEVDLEFEIEPVFYTSGDILHENAGKVALMRGPIVYCIEEQDQAESVFRIRIDTSAAVTVTDEFYGGYPCILAKGYIMPEQKSLYAPISQEKPIKCTVKYIPYYAFANRGEDNMRVWVERF